MTDIIDAEVVEEAESLGPEAKSFRHPWESIYELWQAFAPDRGLVAADPNIVIRFWEKTRDVPSQPGCLEWHAYRNSTGYGKFTLFGRSEYAHRVAYELSVGRIPDGRHVLHTCDNPACVAPWHLRVGTHDENMRARTARGRGGGPESGPGKKLTADDARLIRRLNDEGWTYNQLASRFGVTHYHIGRIVRGVSWRSA